MSNRRPAAAPELTRRTFLAAFGAVSSSALLAGCTPQRIVYVDAIQLNNDSGKLSLPVTLNLRKNATETISVPEWTIGKTEPTEAPVAYSLAQVGGATVKIKVRIKALDILADGTTQPVNGTADIQATGGGILGAIDAKTITLVGGVSSPEFVDMTLSHHTIGSGGVHGVLLEDIEWIWQQRASAAAAWESAGSSQHRVYVVYRKPREPWSNTLGSSLNAWTDALDFACSITGIVGATDVLDDLAGSLASLFNAGGGTCDTAAGSPSTTAAGLMYDIAVSVCHYASDTTVDLTAYLDRWRGGSGNGPLLNCTDCAALFSTLANLLGCNLWQGRIFTGEINPVMPIGCGLWWLPSGYMASFGAFAGEYLSYHEVAWKGDVASTSLIWDVCYLVNGFPDPSDANKGNLTTRLMYYPWGVPFSGTAGALDYREMLAYPAGNNIINTLPDASSKKRRTPV